MDDGFERFLNSYPRNGADSTVFADFRGGKWKHGELLCRLAALPWWRLGFRWLILIVKKRGEEREKKRASAL